jgi:hypothetical protein
MARSQKDAVWYCSFIQSFEVHPLNRCRMCGASSYRPVIDRDASGALRPTGLYRCSGCSVVFADPAAWRDGDSQSWSSAAQDPPPPAHVRGPPVVPQAPDLRTYGATPRSSSA